MRRKILGQYFCYILALFFSWVLVGQVIQSKLTISKLVKVDGIINETIEFSQRRPKGKGKDYELRIFLQNTTEYFRLMDIYKYQNFRDQIRYGDTAEYT